LTLARVAVLGLILVSCGDAFTALHFGHDEAGSPPDAGPLEADRSLPGRGGAPGVGGSQGDGGRRLRADAASATGGTGAGTFDGGLGGARDADADAAPSTGTGGATGGSSATGGASSGGTGGRSTGGSLGSGGAVVTGGAPGTGGADCKPTSCGEQGIECGGATDLCGAPLFCGACQGLSCVSGRCECAAAACPFCAGSPCCRSPTTCGCALFPGGACG
jgi:hypothetical protein